VDIIQAIGEHQAVMEDVRALAPAVERTAAAMTERLRAGGTAYWFGNGGSATQAQHLATELLGRYELERQGFRSIALTADTALLTAIANDYAFDAVFARQIEALCRPGDVVIGLSTSGNSPNVLQGIDAANNIGALTVGLAGGDGGKLARVVDLPLVVPHPRTARVQEAHLFLGHTLCEIVELALAKGNDVRPA
jgi:D-sedoheptulose 7-phosphate isomerase